MINTRSRDLIKFKQVLHYVLYKLYNCDPIGERALYDLLYFIDFDHYEVFEWSLTGETYLKYSFGPFPHDFNTVVGELEEGGLIEEGLIRVVDLEVGGVEHKYVPLVAPVLSKLGKGEVGFIDASLDYYSSMAFDVLNDRARRDVPFLVAGFLEKLDYEFVFYRDAELSVRKYDDAGG